MDDSYFDPPEPRHRDGSLIPLECSCPDCHFWHVEEGQVEANAKTPDYQCCKDEMEEENYEAIEM